MRRLGAVCLVAACGAGQGTEGADSLAIDEEPVVEAVRPLAMPAVPTADRGALALAGDGPMMLTGSWRARAGFCEQPGTLQVLVREAGDGVILLLVLPDSGRLADYPATLEGRMVQVPASQAGVQRIVDDRPQAWHADSGAVTLSAWERNRVSGHFGLAFRNVATNERSLLAGAFRELPVDSLHGRECAVSEPAG